MELQGIEAEKGFCGGACRVARKQCRGCGRAQLLQFANTRVFAFENRLRIEGITQGFCHSGARDLVVERLVAKLNDDEACVLVRGDAWKLVGLTEDEAAGIVVGIQKRGAAGNGRLEARPHHIEPRSLVGNQARGDESHGDLRSGAVKAGAKQGAAMVGNRNKAGRDLIRLGRPLLHIGAIHPNVAGAQTIGGAASDANSVGNRRLGFADVRRSEPGLCAVVRPRPLSGSGWRSFSVSLFLSG